VPFAGHIFENSDCRALAMCACFEKDGQEEAIKRFNCSAGGMHAFNKRHRFTSGAFRDESRPSVTATKKNTGRSNRRADGTVPLDRVLNTDETSWLLWSQAISTCTDLNSDHAHVMIRGDAKDNL
jgi:hypothetical protein